MTLHRSDAQVGLATATEKKMDELYSLIDGIGVAMMTTRRRDGRLVSRAMQTQGRQSFADLWYMASLESHKFEELRNDPSINLSFYRDGTREWVSVSGTAHISRDRSLIHRLYQKEWKAWLGDEGGAEDGSPDDPRIGLILVDVDAVTFFKVDKPRPLVLFEVVKALITGEKPDVGDVRHLTGSDFDDVK
ncbi:MAG: pyridoxamine 5'-phosphate oxidase family protein [Gemmatimonadota bacterium]|nr:pyridoxamine 5'-phosphate oxidase family protein [Gemmatimonadota bacterium]